MRDGEDTDNAKYYAELAKEHVKSVQLETRTLKDQSGGDQTVEYIFKCLFYDAILIEGTYDEEAGTITFHRNQDNTDVKVYLQDGYIWKEELWTPDNSHRLQIWAPPYPAVDVRNGVGNMHAVLYPNKGMKLFMTDFFANKENGDPEECLWTGDSVDGKITWVNDVGHKMEDCNDPYWDEALMLDPNAVLYEG